MELYNPYKGLRAFQEADSDDFFGREALTGQLLAHLQAGHMLCKMCAPVASSSSLMADAVWKNKPWGSALATPRVPAA